MIRTVDSRRTSILKVKATSARIAPSILNSTPGGTALETQKGWIINQIINDANAVDTGENNEDVVGVIDSAVDSLTGKVCF